MAYSDQIEILKNALNGFSAEENKISKLYANAVKNAEKAHELSEKKLDKQFYRDKNAAYADVARNERNFNNALSARGLGFSGEFAQGQLNSNILLSNRLGKLTDEKNAKDWEQDIEFAERQNALAMEQAEKLKDIIDNKNNLNAEIARLELSKENSDADRAAAKEKLDLQIQADKDKTAAQIEADKYLQANKIQADKDMQANQIKADKDKQAAQIQADRNKYNAQIQADKDKQAAQIQAEKDMQLKELEAKYNEIVLKNNNSSDKKPQSGSTVNPENSSNVNQEQTSESYIPEISAKDLGKQLVSSTGGARIENDKQKYIINKYLLLLRKDYNVDSQYYDDLIFALQAYGYEKISEPKMRVFVVGYEAKNSYDQNYDKFYDEYIKNGYDEYNARITADKSAKKAQMDYIYQCTNNLSEFRLCCRNIGFSESKITEYINGKNS